MYGFAEAQRFIGKRLKNRTRQVRVFIGYAVEWMGEALYHTSNNQLNTKFNMYVYYFLLENFGGEGTWTPDLKIMSLASYQAALPRDLFLS